MALVPIVLRTIQASNSSIDVSAVSHIHVDTRTCLQKFKIPPEREKRAYVVQQYPSNIISYPMVCMVSNIFNHSGFYQEEEKTYFIHSGSQNEPFRFFNANVREIEDLTTFFFNTILDVVLRLY